MRTNVVLYEGKLYSVEVNLPVVQIVSKIKKMAALNMHTFSKRIDFLLRENGLKKV